MGSAKLILRIVTVAAVLVFVASRSMADDPGGCNPPFTESCCSGTGCYAGPGYEISGFIYNGCIGSCNSRNCGFVNGCGGVPPPGYDYYYLKDWKSGVRSFDCNGTPKSFECGCDCWVDKTHALCMDAAYGCYPAATPLDCAAERAGCEGQCSVESDNAHPLGSDPCSGEPPPDPQCNGPDFEGGEPVDVLFGSMYHTETDFTDPVATPFDLSVSRTYRSKANSPGPFGNGWFTPFTVRLEFPTTALVRFRDGTGKAWGFIFAPDASASPGFVGVDGHTKALTMNTDGSFAVVDSISGRTYNFASGGKLTSITDATGQALSFGYDGSGNLATVAGAGRTLTFTVSQGVVQSIALNGSSVVSYGYTNGQLTNATYPDGTSKTYVYALQGNQQVLLTQVKDGEGRSEASWTYDSSGRAKTSAGPGGNEALTFDYSTRRVTDPFNKATTYTQNPTGLRVKSISGPGCPSCGDSNVVDATYDSNEWIQSTTDRNGAVTQYQAYDERGNAQTKVEAAGTSVQKTTTYTYHPVTGSPLTATTQSVVNSTQTKQTIWDYDADYNSAFNEAPTGLVHQKIEKGWTRDISGNAVPFQYITSYFYDSVGRLTSINGPRTDVQDLTTFTYDPATGALKTVTSAAGLVTTYGNFDSVGRPGTITDANGNVTNLVYSSRSAVKQSTDVASGAVTKYDYDLAGKLLKITLPRNNTLTFTRDTNGKVKTITDSLGNKVSYAYDGMNNVSSVQITDPQGTLRRSFTTTFDNPSNTNWPGLLWRLGNPNGSFTELAYDGNANASRLTDPDGNVSQLGYDPLNRLSTVTGPQVLGQNVVTSYSYDQQGTLTSLTDAESRQTTFQSDDLGRIVATISPDTGTTRYSYDQAGNVTAKRDNAVNQIGYTYDAENRLLVLAAPDQTITFTYDQTDVTNGKGHVTRVVDNAGMTRYGYDSLGRVTSEVVTIASVIYSTSYGYDLNGDLATLTLPSGDQILYDYDSGDHPSRIRLNRSGAGQPVTIADQITWMPFGPIQSWTYGNGLSAFRSYDLEYRVSEIDEGNLWRSYSYNNSGDVTGITLHSSEALGPPQSHTTYAYQAGTSRVSSITPGSSFTYDTRGNVISYKGLSYAYDSLGRMTGVFAGTPQIAAYAYDYRNLRVRKATSSSTTVYHYDLAGNLVSETDVLGNVLKEYVYLRTQLAGVPVAMVSPTDISYYHVDHLGTPLRMTDPLQRTVWDAGYSAFGVASVAEDPDGDQISVRSNLRLPGQYFDAETGLYYNWHRYYAPELGRYLQPDPIGPAGGDLNLYSYVSQNPLGSTDPMGLRPFDSPMFPGGRLCMSKDCDKGKCPGQTLPEDHPDMPTWPLQDLPAPGTCIEADAVYTPRGVLKIPDNYTCTISCATPGPPVIECHWYYPVPPKKPNVFPPGRPLPPHWPPNPGPPQ